MLHFFFIYSTSIRAEYFKHAAYSLFFPLQNAVYFIMLNFWFLYYSHFIYRMCSNLKENSGSKGLMDRVKGVSPEDDSILSLFPVSSALKMDQHYPPKR